MGRTLALSLNDRAITWRSPAGNPILFLLIMQEIYRAPILRVVSPHRQRDSRQRCHTILAFFRMTTGGDSRLANAAAAMGRN